MSKGNIHSHVVHKTVDNRWYVPQPERHIPYFVVASVVIPTWRPLMLISGMENTYVGINVAPGIWVRDAAIVPAHDVVLGIWETRLLTVCEWIGGLFS